MSRKWNLETVIWVLESLLVLGCCYYWISEYFFYQSTVFNIFSSICSVFLMKSTALTQFNLSILLVRNYFFPRHGGRHQYSIRLWL